MKGTTDRGEIGHDKGDNSKAKPTSFKQDMQKERNFRDEHMTQKSKERSKGSQQVCMGCSAEEKLKKQEGSQSNVRPVNDQKRQDIGGKQEKQKDKKKQKGQATGKLKDMHTEDNNAIEGPAYQEDGREIEEDQGQLVSMKKLDNKAYFEIKKFLNKSKKLVLIHMYNDIMETSCRVTFSLKAMARGFIAQVYQTIYNR